METISKCPHCKSERLLQGTMEDSWFCIPDRVFRFLHSDIPKVLVETTATACLDCGVIVTSADAAELRKTAARWMSDEAKKRSLGIE